MSNKKVLVIGLVLFAAGWFAKGYFSTATAEETTEEPKEETAED